MIYTIQKYWLHITCLLLVSIATLSLWPAAYLPAVPGTDKTHHFIAYGALIFPTALKQPKNTFLIIVGFAAFSGAIELIQPYVNRYGEWLDMLANTLGLLCGWVLAKIMLHFYQEIV
ncbi:VanZ family protein [Colwellia sp. MSW7]|jgi:VanZ family protein|uniref:VanZ family protein n=1 Tax=Colwellia maritima TaxID=2912588 RepID=A0ABS9WZN4_9GAMM|nr:VanZ family protein [Colwellia maritima]MCI2282686.1 VanZ family protein [Colwellia maritima]